MSRTNPFKKKRHQADKTLLIFGEGLGEEMFLKHLKKVYCCNTNVAVKIVKGKGGNAQNIVIDAYKTPGDFNRRIVLLDNDKSKSEMAEARKEAKNRNIELIENTPCLEFLLLSILGFKSDPTNSSNCKKEFESKFIDKTKRSEPKEYDKIFTKQVLEVKRKSNDTLNKIINIMEGK